MRGGGGGGGGGGVRQEVDWPLVPLKNMEIGCSMINHRQYRAVAIRFDTLGGPGGMLPQENFEI